MRFLVTMIFAYAVSTGVSAADTSFDAREVAGTCRSADCPAAIAEALAALSLAGSDQAGIDEFIAAVAGELLVLAQENPSLNAPISAALTIAATYATPGSALAQDVALLAQLIAEGHAASLSLTAFNGATQPLSHTAPTAGQNGSDS